MPRARLAGQRFPIGSAGDGYRWRGFPTSCRPKTRGR
jgi:hypothetical protein